jgi:apolipoprotein N-acyltransferase
LLSKPALFSAVLSGLLLGATLIGHGPFFHVHWALFFGFVPLWNVWFQETDWRKIFLAGWICQLVFTLVAFHWVAYTVNEFSHLGPVLSTFVLLLYCALANLPFPIAGLLWHRFFRKPQLGKIPQIAALALLTAACLRIGTAVFHWNFGYVWLYMNWPGFQLADVVGFQWLSTFSVVLNGYFLAAWQGRKTKNYLAPLACAVAMFLLINLLGLYHLQHLPPPDARFRVLLIQPNIGNRDKEKIEHKADFHEVALQRYFDITDKALSGQKVDFAIWPENAFPNFIVDSELSFQLSKKLKRYIQNRELNLLTGSYGVTAEGKVANSLFALSKNGKWSSPPYHKMILLPFGEYIPGSEIFPSLKKWLPDIRDYGRGNAPMLLELANLKIGPQICYEGLFASTTRDLANLGAQAIVNITNDSWYGTWMEPWQHLYITLARAIEVRRPLLRDTNTGISTVILADGTILESSPIGEEWHHAYDVPYLKHPPATPFMGWGFWFDWFYIGAGVAWILLLIFRKASAPLRNTL